MNSYYHALECLSAPLDLFIKLINKSRELGAPGAQCVVVTVHGSQTENLVPEDGFNETTHHVLLHGLSLLPLPNRVHTLNSQHQNIS